VKVKDTKLSLNPMYLTRLDLEIKKKKKKKNNEENALPVPDSAQ